MLSSFLSGEGGHGPLDSLYICSIPLCFISPSVLAQHYSYNSLLLLKASAVVTQTIHALYAYQVKLTPKYNTKGLQNHNMPICIRPIKAAFAQHEHETFHKYKQQFVSFIEFINKALGNENFKIKSISYCNTYNTF